MKKFFLLFLAVLLTGCQFTNKQNIEISEEDKAFFCPPPEKSGLNTCLNEIYRNEYPSNRYEGEKMDYFDSLLIELASQKKSKAQIEEELRNIGSWSEKSPEINNNEIQYIISDLLVGSFKTTSHLANEIWAERINKNLSMDGTYFNVAIYYDKKTETNTVAVIGLAMPSLDPNAWIEN